MTRLLLFAFSVVFLATAGCGNKASQTADSDQAPESAPSESVSNASVQDSSGSNRAGDSSDRENASLAQSAQAPPLTREQGFAKDVGELMAKAHQQETSFDYEGAIATWNAIHAQIATEYGVESWQATNARLAIQTAKRRSEMDIDQRRQMYDLNSLVQQAEQISKSGDPLAILTVRSQICDSSRKLWGPESHLLAGHLLKQAQAHQAIGQYPEAETLMNKTLEIRGRSMGKVHPEYCSVLHALAILYQQQGAYELATPPMKESVDLCRQVFGEGSKPLATYLNDLGVLQYTVSDWAAAETTLRNALACYEAAGYSEGFDYAHCNFNLANVLFAANKNDAAEAGFRSALAEFLRARDEDHEMVQQSRTQLATILLVKKNPAEAEPILADVVAARKRYQGSTHPAYAKSLFQLGVSYGLQGKYDLAEPTLREAYGLQRQLLPPNDPELIRTTETLAVLLKKRGLDSEAESLENQARLARDPNGNTIR